MGHVHVVGVSYIVYEMLPYVSFTSSLFLLYQFGLQLLANGLSVAGNKPVCFGVIVPGGLGYLLSAAV